MLNKQINRYISMHT